MKWQNISHVTIATKMPLAAHTKVGSYEILELLGAAGMGEVYRAHNPRLKRDVALKVLPHLFASDPQRMTRFEREAQLLASLSHPNIASIYGLEESGSTRAFVMELVAGCTLAERIGRGLLPLGEALPVARKIAEALEYAHERGIVHRDLKPANVFPRGRHFHFTHDHGCRYARGNHSRNCRLCVPRTGARPER